MSQNEVDLLAFDRGSVVAPAGCGKTHLIVDALKRHDGAKPILVLTHTNAGVAALRDRLGRRREATSFCRILTIDGWAISLIRSFPRRSGFNQEHLKLPPSKIDYPGVRDAAIRLLESGHISDILKSSYARLLVDEYQDCSIRQHRLISLVAKVVPTNVVGDPMQAIFGFGDDAILVDWCNDVIPHFPLLAKLDVPYRWINAEEELLGKWLLDVRGWIEHGTPVDLKQAPPGVKWMPLHETNADELRLQAARTMPPNGTGSVIVLADSTSPKEQQRIARETTGALAIESVDLKDLVKFAHEFNNPCSPGALRMLLAFAQEMVRNVDVESILRQVDSLRSGAAQDTVSKVENAMLAFAKTPSYRTAEGVLKEIGKQSKDAVYRPVILQACLSALQTCRNGDISFADAAIRTREEYRIAGRRIPKRGVGSTLLLKGLEAEVAVVLNASDLDAKNLYVAMTRGTKKLIVCARSNILNPPPPSLAGRPWGRMK